MASLLAQIYHSLPQLGLLVKLSDPSCIFDTMPFLRPVSSSGTEIYSSTPIMLNSLTINAKVFGIYIGVSIGFQERLIKYNSLTDKGKRQRMH